jgi:hypothetical protein
MRRRKPLPTTVPKAKPPRAKAIGGPRERLPQTALPLKPAPRRAEPRPPRQPLPRRAVASIIDDGDRSLVDVLDSLLNQGVVLNADLVLALADVDLVYVKLSALLVAADRILPPRDA